MLTIDLSGKTALVTGAGAGIGAAVAVELARTGAFVVLNYRHNEGGAHETLSQIEQQGGRGLVVKADVSKAAEVERLMGEVEAKTGRLDILVNNAGGLIERCQLADMSETLWDEVMDINLKSTFLCSKAALPLMKGRGWGRIINMSSMAAHEGGGYGAGAYAASKAAIISLTKALAKEVADQGITVNCVAPGLINTAFQDNFTSPDSRLATVKNTPLGREGQSPDVATAVLFLASDLAAFITGETININGGLRMY